ncbi:MAG TPA: tetratricopeptide repeat protein [Kofleriaceae bacterium]|nr:tetratricopeptide repeat protein [Kofleriaceae bacterium]
MPDPKQDSKSGVEDGWDDQPAQQPAHRPQKPSRPHLPGVNPKPGQDQSSLALLAKDLMPPPAASQAPTQIDVNTVGNASDRKVQDPGLKIKLKSFVRRWSGKLTSFVKNRKLVAISLAGTIVIVLVLIIVLLAGGGGSKQSRGAKLAKQGQELLNANDAKHAAELIESELVGAAQAGDGEAYLVLGHARFAMKRYLEAVTAYERALTLSPKLASDKVLRGNATKVLESKDSVAAVVALELLASRVTPPANDVVVQYASTGKLQDARRRAFAIAEREGIADKIDRVESWSLDLAAAGTCEDRRTIVAKLASTKDKRAIPALKKMKLYKCAEKDATDAIAEIEGGGAAGSAEPK